MTESAKRQRDTPGYENFVLNCLGSRTLANDRMKQAIDLLLNPHVPTWCVRRFIDKHSER